MRIGIDARLNAYRAGGIANYTRQLLSALAALAPSDSFVAIQHRQQPEPLVVAPNVRPVAFWTPPHNRFEQLSLPLELLPLRLDLLHSPDFVPPLRRTCPAVITIHDLAFIRYPEILDDDARRFYSQVHAAVRSADAVIAVSAATRADIAELLDFPPERVDLVYEAAAPTFRALELAPGARRLINGHELEADSFALFVSTLEPRKNLPTLLRALHLCLDRQPATPYRLVIGGGRGWREDAIFATLHELKLGDAVLFLGAVGQDDLLWLYNACRLYLNPSLYEGFGLPVLEALSCAAPTLVADTSSLPEIVGDAARLLPPRDEAAWAEAIATLWADDEARAALARRGPARAAQFSWTRTARETLAIYRRVVQQRKRT